jgi:hypothetical protein
MNPIRMKQPVAHTLGFTKLQLRHFRSVGEAGSLNFDRLLADLSLMTILTEHILHKSSDVVCHIELPLLT